MTDIDELERDENTQELAHQLRQAHIRIKQVDHGYDTLRTVLHRREARIEALEEAIQDQADEMMRAVVRSHDATGTRAIWSDVVHAWAVRLAALAAKEEA